MKKILIIGAGFLQTFVIKKAKALGYYTLAVDANQDAEGFKYTDKSAAINIVDEKACLEFAKAEKIDGVLTAATDYGVLTASYIAEKMGLPGLNYESAKLIKNKYLVRKCLFDNQVDDTKQTYEVNADTDIEALSLVLNYPVMVKPCDGSGSRGASRVDSAGALKQACQYAMAGSITHRAEIESFIFGQEYGAESLVVNGVVHVLGIMRKWMTAPPYYAELGHAIPCGLSKELEMKVRGYISRAIIALGVNHGSINMDLLITDHGDVHIVDVVARMGGNLIGSHIIPRGTGIDYMGNTIRVAVGDGTDFRQNWSPMPVATKLLALTPGKILELPDFNKIAVMCDVQIEHHLRVGDVINEYHTNLDGCGYVIASGFDVADAIDRAEMARKLIDKQIVRQ